jgi:Holliday junction resolvasome RuvABC DNA-binding subunit
MSSNHTFKAIKPYEMQSRIEADTIIDDALLGLKELGYKTADINGILPQLMEKEYATSAECLKEGLRLLSE